ALFARVVEAVRAGADAAIPVLPVTDTVKEVRDGVVVATTDRSHLATVQTPQAFNAPLLRRAYQLDADTTDDAALVELAGGTVRVVEGERTNVKITDPGDLEIAAAYLSVLQSGGVAAPGVGATAAPGLTPGTATAATSPRGEPREVRP